MSQSRNTTSRPLAARSVLASVLLGTEPPRLPTALLLRTAELFGIAEGTARVALSRMVTAGEAVADGTGYRLAGRLVARQARQASSRRADRGPWDGTYELAVVDGEGRRAAADRAALRDALRALRLAELREGVWTRPANLAPDRSPEAAQVAATWCRWWRGTRPDQPPHLTSLFDLPSWSGGAEELRADMAALLPALEAHDRGALAAGFVTSASVLRHLQADPLLPDELLPGGWPGVALREDYDRYDAAYRAVLTAWFREASA